MRKVSYQTALHIVPDMDDCMTFASRCFALFCRRWVTVRGGMIRGV